MKKVLVIDNYDSFTYNLVHYLEDLDCKVTVIRNDEIEAEDVEPFEYIVVSPGPGLPQEAGALMPILKKYAAHKIILGVCLGHQAISEVFGGALTNLESVQHGISSTIKVEDKNCPLYHLLPNEMKVGRYHSWVVNPATMHPDFIITARDNNGAIMSFRHKTFKLFGVQYHPESIMTPYGKQLLANWLNVK